MTTLRTLKAWLISRRFRAMTRRFDAAISAARQAHRPVRHLLDAKRSFVHSALRGVR